MPVPPPYRPTTPRAARRRRTLACLLAALATTGGTAVGTAANPAAAAPTAGTDHREAAVAAAAAAYGVPVRLLSAYSYAQTRWEDHDGQVSTDGGVGPAHLVDASALETGGRDGGGPGDDSGVAGKERADTLGRAARLTGHTRDRLRTDPAANLRGAAALLADAQRRLGRPLGTGSDPASWYGAVAATGTTEAAGVELADAVVAVLRTGAARTTSDGDRMVLPASPVGPAAAAQRREEADELRPVPPRRKTPRRDPDDGLDCPDTLDCEWLPAPYERLSASSERHGNHDRASRPADPAITTIVIHDTEGYYDNDVRMVQDPRYVGWQYTIRSRDGHVAQHLAAKDIGWQAGNWYVNTHSIGIEHEGFAAKGATWFSEAMYRSSAALVRHLAHRYAIPLDRGHVIGHDQVPGTTAGTTRSMHWDPGPYWDWGHYFDLLGAPIRTGTVTPGPGGGQPEVGAAVRVLPRFATNVQPITGCRKPAVPCPDQGSNVVPVRTRPDDDAPLVNDIGLTPSGAASTWAIADWGGKAASGLDYVVADVQGDWVGLWFAGRLGWVHNPTDAPVLRELRRATVARPRGDVAAAYGRAYPEASAYPAGIAPQPVVPLPYRLTKGQSYVVLDDSPPTDYHRAASFDLDAPNDHVTVTGRDRYLLVSLGHRLAYVRRAEVDVVRAR